MSDWTPIGCACAAEDCRLNGCAQLRAGAPSASVYRAFAVPVANERFPLRFRAYPLIQRAVAEGIAYGYRRAHKHTDTPSEEYVKEEMERGVMDALCDILSLDEEDTWTNPSEKLNS